MNEQHRAELKALEARMEYRDLLQEAINWINSESEDGESLVERRPDQNHKLVKVATFHAHGYLHMQEADAVETGDTDETEILSNLRHLAAESFAVAWAFAEELDEDLVDEVLKDAKRDAAVYRATKERLEGVRKLRVAERRLEEGDGTP